MTSSEHMSRGMGGEALSLLPREIGSVDFALNTWSDLSCH